jgi:hypothetical protein
MTEFHHFPHTYALHHIEGFFEVPILYNIHDQEMKFEAMSLLKLPFIDQNMISPKGPEI